jgi:hypothetical protein
MEALAAIVTVLAAVAYFVVRLIIFAHAARHKQERDRRESTTDRRGGTPRPPRGANQGR